MKILLSIWLKIIVYDKYRLVILDYFLSFDA